MLEELIEHQNKLGGINVTKLTPGTRILVVTLNNNYVIEILGGSRIKIKGGKYFPKETEADLLGSSWDSPALRLFWIGYDMHMEIMIAPLKPIKTSRVQAAVVFNKGWRFVMEWPLPPHHLSDPL